MSRVTREITSTSNNLHYRPALTDYQHCQPTHRKPFQWRARTIRCPNESMALFYKLCMVWDDAKGSLCNSNASSLLK
ncbi:unnamed protein product [Brugia pahangi]|uniref:Uncharacterized protein n=1 Tax=Brugia pahangi TaxID=6280 RepID=A0A3P7R5Z2_BRUPA|nr:unnamed protein product [Brugia pahangi]